MKRFITIAAREGEAFWIEFRNAAAGTAGTAAMTLLIDRLRQKGIRHNDQQAHSEKALPQQGGYISFYVDGAGRLTKVNH